MNVQDKNTSRSRITDPSLGPAGWAVVTEETPATLLERWHQQREPVGGIIAFYQDRKGNQWREFSNFYQRKGHSFDFVLLLELLEIAGVSDKEKRFFEPVVHCDFSEKAIMLCKAAVMGNATYYAKIAASETPKKAKILGRQISPWDHERWQRVVCGVAVAILRQKFAVPDLRDVLLSTGDKIL
jgi:hypothetical protein